MVTHFGYLYQHVRIIPRIMKMNFSEGIIKLRADILCK